MSVNMPGSLLSSAAGSFICHTVVEDCVSWSEGEWKINPNCCFKRWLIIKGRSLRMILIHKRLMMSLKRSHAICKILEKSGPSFIHIRSALSEYEPLHANHSGKSVNISYLGAASVEEEFKNMESVFFFFLFTFILMKGQAEFLCLLSISAASQQTTEQATENWQIYSLKRSKIIFFYLSWDMRSAQAFERMQRVSVHTLSYLAACLDLDFFKIFFRVWSRILYH